MHHTIPDEEIVRLLQNGGDKNLFGILIQKYETGLQRYIQKLVNCPEADTADIVQDTFISAYINLNSFVVTKRFSSWLYRIAHNKGVDYIKKKYHHKTYGFFDFDDFLGGESLLEDTVIREELKHSLRSALESLPLKYKAVFNLYCYEEKSYEEISEILHIPVSHVGVLIFRGKKLLRQKFPH